MKKLTKVQLSEKVRHFSTLSDTARKLTDAIEAINKAIEAAQETAETYNEAVAAANEWLAEVHDDLQAHFDEKSEKWQESDAGSAFQSWMESFSIELDTFEFSCEPADAFEDAAVTTLEELPEECE